MEARFLGYWTQRLDAKDWPPERCAQYLLGGQTRRPIVIEYVVCGRSARPPERLQDLGDVGPTPPGSVVLAGLAFVPEARAEEWWESPPRAPDPAWTLLGYDVIDGGLISGLTNCGYRAEERDPIEREFGSSLNAFHLLMDRDVADRFRDVTDARVSEHAPFYVAALYLVRGDLSAWR